LLLLACAPIPAAPPKPIELDTSTVTNIPSLIAAIRKAAGNRIPTHYSDSDFHKELAQVFVEYAHAAADNGYPIPDWVLQKIPRRKVGVLFPSFIIMVFFGVPIKIAVAVIFMAVIASVALMTVAILSAIAALWFILESANLDNSFLVAGQSS
jgi:hypothetical protein